jgi:hypothetical protein
MVTATMQMTDAREAGAEHFKTNPDALLVEVARTAARRYAERADYDAFVEGFQRARQLRDQFIREKALT